MPQGCSDSFLVKNENSNFRNYNFRGLKKFKIENLPNFVVLTGESAECHNVLKENIISPDRQPKTCTSSDPQCHGLVNNNSITCEISAKFELGQLEMDYLRRKNRCDTTSLANNAYIKDNYNDINIDRFDCISPSRSAREESVVKLPYHLGKTRKERRQGTYGSKGRNRK